jgi:D-alanyl-D-alanine carboxypeptidase
MSGAGCRAALQRLADEVARGRHIPHVVLAVESMDRSFRWAYATGTAAPGGKAGGEPMTAATPFFIASIDKTFVATVVLQLHEEGVLSVDDAITAHLPPPLVRGLHRAGGTDRTSQVTIRNLLGHTSGLPDYLEDYPARGVSLIQRLFREEDRELPLETVIRVARDELTPHFPPQQADARKQRARYSDTNYQLLAAIIEATCRSPLHDVVTDRIIRRLDLRHTWYAGHTEPADTTPAPAALWVDDRALDRPRLLRSLHSVFSTAADLMTFLRALVRGELFRDAATLALMQARWNGFGFPRDRAALRAPSWPIEYGLGLMRFALPRVFTPRGRIPAVIGHTGSTGTWLFWCPELDVLVAGAVNQATAGAVPFRLVPRVLRAYSCTSTSVSPSTSLR